MIIKDSNPRWSIIAGYYAMHDVAKLYLGKVHNLKIAGKNVHKQTIGSLKWRFRTGRRLAGNPILNSAVSIICLDYVRTMPFLKKLQTSSQKFDD